MVKINLCHNQICNYFNFLKVQIVLVYRADLHLFDFIFLKLIQGFIIKLKIFILKIVIFYQIKKYFIYFQNHFIL
jgi:hypothetical protein